jgi:hypothetical protein
LSGQRDRRLSSTSTKVAVGKPARDGYPRLLTAARNAVSAGHAIFLLSATHLMEGSVFDVVNFGGALRTFTPTSPRRQPAARM